jgi:hypothetical protein
MVDLTIQRKRRRILCSAFECIVKRLWRRRSRHSSPRPGDIEEINALFLGQVGDLSPRVRAVVDFLAKTVPSRLSEVVPL